MTNPYKAPRSGTSERPSLGGRSRTGYVQLGVSLLVAVFCVLQFWGVMLAALRFLSGGDGSGPLLPVLWVLARPAILFVSGVLLVFQRKLATYGFAAYLVTGLLTLPEFDRTGVLVSLLVISAILAYSLHLQRAGRLR